MATQFLKAKLVHWLAWLASSNAPESQSQIRWKKVKFKTFKNTLFLAILTWNSSFNVTHPIFSCLRYSIMAGNMWALRSLLMYYKWVWHHLFNYFHRPSYKISLCASRGWDHKPSRQCFFLWMANDRMITLVFLTLLEYLC